MPNWDRTPPKSGMPIEEIKRRVEDGIRRRRMRGDLRPITKPLTMVPDPKARGAERLTREQRKRLVAACNLAIVSLANMDRADYCAAIDAINATRREAGIRVEFMATIANGVAAEAAELAACPVADVNYLARTWLASHYAPSGRVISIPKPKDKAHEDRAEQPDGQVH